MNHNHQAFSYALFKRSGKQIRRSLKTTDKALSRRCLEELRHQVGRLKVGIKDLSFKEFTEKWLLTLKDGESRAQACGDKFPQKVW